MKLSVRKPKGLRSASDYQNWSIRELSRVLQAEAKTEKVDYNSPDGIVAFVRDIIGANPTAYQEQILRDFVRLGRMAVRAPHGAGKTALSSWIVLWAVTCIPGDVKVITTASAWRQVEKFTWPEIRMWAARANWERMGIQMRRGKELLQLQIKRGEKVAFGAASDNPAYIEGAHATTMVYVFDEAKAIPADIWDAAEGAFSGAGGDTGARAYALAISTPGAPSGRFYDICTRKRGYEDWESVHITLEDCIKAGRISAEWVEQRKKQWGETSAVYANRVLGEFDMSGEGNVIPLGWVELANERWYAWKEGLEATVKEPDPDDYLDAPEEYDELMRAQVTGIKEYKPPVLEKPTRRPPPLPCYGIDPAYKGEDNTAICKLEGRIVHWINSYSKQEPMQTAGRVANLVKNKKEVCAVDSIGIGAGLYSRLKELGHATVSVTVSKKTKSRDSTGLNEFVNLRSYVWWVMREALDPHGDDPIALPPDAGLTGDLTAPGWGYRSDGKIQVDSKDIMRERIGRSPDKADALGLALYGARRRRIGMV